MSSACISPARTKRLETLLIVSHVPHSLHCGRIYAYGPYAREIDIWADLFPRVVIAAPCREEEAAGDSLALTRKNISIWPQRNMGGTTIRSKIGLLVSLPGVIADLQKAMRVADAIHVRCPGNLGLLGALLAPLYSKCLIAKYAGQWNGYPGEAWTVRLQRALLRSRWWAGPVTVYGEWPGQPVQVVPFFTSMLADDQIRSIVERRSHRGNGVLRVLFVGRLSASKNVHVLVEAAAVLKSERIPISCSVVGEGPERKNLEQLSRQLGVNDCVEFAGGVPLDRVLDFYSESDALVLPSQTEGWPKVVAEAMAFGLICIASDRGYVAQMLGEGRGILVPPGDTPAVARALREAALNPSLFEGMRGRASEWSRRYSLEGLRDALHKLLSERWGVTLASSTVNAGGGSR